MIFKNGDLNNEIPGSAGASLLSFFIACTMLLCNSEIFTLQWVFNNLSATNIDTTGKIHHAGNSVFINTNNGVLNINLLTKRYHKLFEIKIIPDFLNFSI